MKTKLYLLALLTAVVIPSMVNAVIQHEYFPVTQYASWLYDDGSHVYVSEAIDKGTKMDVTITNVNRTGVSYLYVTADEVGWTQSDNSDYILMRRIPPYPLLSYPLTPGKQWSNYIVSNGLSVDFTCTIISTNNVVTSYSTTYSNCVSVNVDFSFPVNYPETPYITNRVVHFAKNVGCVRRDDMWSDGTDSSIQLRSYTIGTEPPPPAGPAYEVWDFSINVKWVTYDKEKYKVKSGTARGWIVTHEDGEASAFIYERSGHEQLPCQLQTEYYEVSEMKGLASMEFDLIFNNADYSGVVLGTYSEKSTSLQGSGSGTHTGNDSYAKKMRVKRNRKMSEEINEAASAQEYIEVALGKKVKDPYISLDWSWLAP